MPMGLLDEAIRQHLELKRQHGASDEELHMQEQEALGPVRREPVEPAVAEPDEAEPPPEAALEQDVDEAYDEPPMEAGVDAPVYEEAPAEPEWEEAPIEPPQEELHEPIDPYAEPAPADADPATESLSPDEGFDSLPGGETPSRGFDAVEEPVAEDAVPEAGEEAEDDVLEETPEFLQETPEHDKLWFEQKPPRDFDFDE